MNNKVAKSNFNCCFQCKWLTIEVRYRRSMILWPVFLLSLAGALCAVACRTGTGVVVIVVVGAVGRIVAFTICGVAGFAGCEMIRVIGTMGIFVINPVVPLTMVWIGRCSTAVPVMKMLPPMLCSVTICCVAGNDSCFTKVFAGCSCLMRTFDGWATINWGG